MNAPSSLIETIIKSFSHSSIGKFQAKLFEGTLPPDLSGFVFIVAPYHRRGDRHLFAGEGVITKWKLGAPDTVAVHSQRLETWDSFWRDLFPAIDDFLKPFLPAVLSPLGIAEIANTAIAKCDGRLILTADAGRYWEVDPIALETITPIGYFDEHIVSVPLSFFPMVANTAHPFYDPNTKELISCELKVKLRPGNLFNDMLSAPYITRWNGAETLEHWELEGTVLDGSPHTTIVTEDWIAIPDMPFQMGLTTVLGIKVPPLPTYPKTQIYFVRREDLHSENHTVPSRLVTFEGDSYHFLSNYHAIEGKVKLVAVQQATISVSEAIRPDDVKHFSGDRYSKAYHGIPWMFAFDPGVLRKVFIKEAQLDGEEAFIHPGWFSTTLYTADPRELFSETGYSAIYQVYVGYLRDLICRRQYLSFRDCPNRILTDEQLPPHDLPSVLAKVPLDPNWQELTAKIKSEQAENPDTPVAYLGKNLLDFYVFPEGKVLNSVQFIPQEKEKGYIFTTVLTPERLEAWLFAADNLSNGPVAKLCLPEKVHFGFTLHSEYFETLSASPHTHHVDRTLSALRSLLKVPYEFVFNRRDDILNRK